MEYYRAFERNDSLTPAIRHESCQPDTEGQVLYDSIPEQANSQNQKVA